MAAPIVISILANASQANRELNRTATTAQKVGKGFQKMAVPAVAALGAIAVGAKQTIDAASDLSETIAKTGEIFGPQAAEIEKFASRADKALGQSTRSALDAASTFGIIGQSAGLSNTETAAFSKQFVTLSSDLASFNNTSPEEAITAIGAAMRGEAEPIRKYGVLLDDATLRNRALKLGLIDSVKQALTPQQKALAASKEILAQTSKAQGDFARTSDGAANKSRILAAQQENLKAKIGTGLLPVYVKLQTRLIQVIDYLGKHDKEAKIGAGVIAALAAAVVAVNVAMKISSAVTAINTAVTKLNTKAAAGSTRALLLTRGAAAGAAGGLLALSASGKLGSGSLSKVATVAGSVAAGFAVGGPFGAVIGAAGSLLAVGTKSKESAALQKSFLSMQQEINAQAKTLTSTLDEQSGAITKNTRTTILKNLADNGAFTAADKVGVSYDTVTRAALGNKAAQGQVTAATQAYIAKQLAAAHGADELKTAYGRATKATGPLTSSVKSFSSELGHAKTATNQTKVAIAQMEERAKKSAGSMRGAGSNAGRGFRDGVAGWLDKISAIGQTIAAAVQRAAENKLEIKSPSRVFRQIGQYTGQGLAEGIIASTPLAVSAISDTVKRVTKAGSGLTLDAGLISARPGAGVINITGRPTSGTTYNITVQAPVGASSAEIGRTLTKHLKEYERTAGR